MYDEKLKANGEVYRNLIYYQYINRILSIYQLNQEPIHLSLMKVSKIVPVFKSDDECDASNYQPIFLLSNFNRIFEKVMYNRMKDFIEKLGMLNPPQYGFRQAHATQQAIIDIVEATQTNIYQRLFTCGIFVHLKKAFDAVNHKILLYKLHHYGFRGIVNNWLTSHLSNRIQTKQICPSSVTSRVVYHRDLY